jgi:excisionase family DNA binding protein
MSEFLTTREVAELIRVKERKVYDLVAKGEIPVRRLTGKLLFSRAEIDAWMTRGVVDGRGSGPVASVRGPVVEGGTRPSVFAGGHDPLLEWALRQSGSGIAAFLDGALDGLERAAAGECVAAGLHIPEGDGWNVGRVRERFGHEPWVLVEWARRTRGLIVRHGLGSVPRTLRQAGPYRFQRRQAAAGSELILDHLLEKEGLSRDELNVVAGVERSETDLALAIAGGRADLGLGIEAAARQFGLDFVPLISERFDLMIWRHGYFEAPMQRFLAFCRTEAFRERARELGGYDVSGFGNVHYNGG